MDNINNDAENDSKIDLTELDYEDSLQLLKSANGEVKTAIIMKKKNCTYEEGIQLLKNVSGSLKKVIGE